MATIDYNAFDVNNVVYSEPIKLQDGCYHSVMKYNNTDICIETPALKLLNGLINKKNYIEFIFGVENKDLYTFFVNIDKLNIKMAHENSKAWFNNVFPLGIIADFYKSNIKPGKNATPPSIKFKYSLDNNINTSGEFRATIKLNGLRFSKQQFIAEWTILDLNSNMTQSPPIVGDLTVIPQPIENIHLAVVEKESVNKEQITRHLIRKEQRKLKNITTHNTIIEMKKELISKLIIEAKRAEKIAEIKKKRVEQAEAELKQLEDTNYLSDETTIGNIM